MKKDKNARRLRALERLEVSIEREKNMLKQYADGERLRGWRGRWIERAEWEANAILRNIRDSK